MTKLRPSTLFLTLLASFSLFLGACAQVMPPCNSVNAPAIQDVQASQWTLIRWHYTSPNDGKTRQRSIPHGENKNPLSLNFSPDGKSVSGYSGCNLYTAQVQVGDKGFVLEKIAGTRKACDPAASELEYKFLSHLSNYRSIVRDGDRLLIMTRDNEVLSFSLKN